jgi:hypothetical protein
MVIQAPVAHVCNLRYLGGRDQEDHGFRPAKVKSSQDGITTVKAGCGWFQASQGTKFTRRHHNSKSWVWWHTHVIPATTGNRTRKVTVQADPG